MSCNELRYWVEQSIPYSELPSSKREFQRFYVSTIGSLSLSNKLDNIKDDKISLRASSYIKAYLDMRGIETGGILSSAYIRFSFSPMDIPEKLLKSHVLSTTFPEKYGMHPVEFIPILVLFDKSGHSMMLILDNINKYAYLLDINGPYATWSKFIVKVIEREIDYKIKDVTDVCPVNINIHFGQGICSAWTWFILMMKLACKERNTKRVITEFLRLSEEDQRRALLTFIVEIYNYKKMKNSHW